MVRVSVCMAAYNGSQYIREQVLSILEQLTIEDELLVIDDCSSDETFKILKEFQSPLIKLFQNKSNSGVIKTFEKAISKAQGNIIFLSDQDDVWLPGKVDKFLSIFKSYADVTLVLSDAEIINEQGVKTNDSFFQLRGRFTSNPFSNFLKSKHHGCTLAFRREMLILFLPFPEGTPMHDIWIGIVNGIYGRAFYIDEALIQHRRHSKNTGRGIFNRADVVQILRWRFTLARNIVGLILKNGLNKRSSISSS